MLTGEALGSALKEAMRLKKVTQKQVAAEFGIAQPSVSDWTRTGRVAKEHLNHLVAYFRDVVGPEHWGLQGMDNSVPDVTVYGSDGVARFIEVKKYLSVGHVLQAVSRVTRQLPAQRKKAIDAMSTDTDDIADCDVEAIDNLASGAIVALDVPSLEIWETAKNMASNWPVDEIKPYLLDFIERVERAQVDKIQLEKMASTPARVETER